MDAYGLRKLGEKDALVGKTVEAFYEIPDIEHTDEARKQYEMGWRATDSELRREGR